MSKNNSWKIKETSKTIMKNNFKKFFKIWPMSSKILSNLKSISNVNILAGISPKIKQRKIHIKTFLQ